ncbi:MAG: ferredoxin [Candidatus Diapherotrites archaeon CG08_land_8_20_14_0_20_34_12]|nr:MAG: ferredoxin [Candidatus Diapherotrites archaeon CG08_land_8_20_14_0_20_34_12]
MSTKTIIVDGNEVKTDKEMLIDAIKDIGIKVPSLCHHPDLKPWAVCRLCIVDVDGKIVTSCNTQVREGMKILTHSERILDERKMNLKLILANHPFACESCIRNGYCELQKLAEEMNVKKEEIQGETRNLKSDYSSLSIVREPNKCILCNRCVEACDKQHISILEYNGRGFKTIIGPAFDNILSNTPCVSCGQCALHCPVAAITERNQTREVMHAVNDPTKHVVVQIAPAIRVSVGESLGLEPGTVLTEKLVTALKMLGFDAVLDTSTGADLTTMEEAHEFIERLKNNEKERLPLITSCCPGWVNYCEFFQHDFIKNMSTCKSPHMMLGALIKTYYAKEKNIDPKNIVVVSIMPCTAKKNECNRVEMKNDLMRNVDYVLTTRELASMLKMTGIKVDQLQESAFDNPIETASSAGVMFGATGGVAESVLRTAGFMLTGKKLKKLEFESLRGMKGIKIAEADLDGKKIRVAIVHGLGRTDDLLKQIKSGEVKVDLIEVMACYGGCIGGGGQPIPTTKELIQKRMDAIYKIDDNSELRTSYENPNIQSAYYKFLKEPGSDISHKYLHTRYFTRDPYNP